MLPVLHSAPPSPWGSRLSCQTSTLGIAFLGCAGQLRWGQSQPGIGPGTLAGTTHLVDAQNDAGGTSRVAVLSSVLLPGYKDPSAHA